MSVKSGESSAQRQSSGCYFCGKTEHERGEYHEADERYVWDVMLDYALWLNAKTPRQRADHFMRVEYVEEYGRQGAPRGFQWPLEK